jgi:ferric-dicitrate binding protein FerR (iron transport regulator)
MILTTAQGDFPIPPEVARRLPDVPLPRDDASLEERRAFDAWLAAHAENTIAHERLRRWHKVQEELSAEAAAAGQPFTVTADGLD